MSRSHPPCRYRALALLLFATFAPIHSEEKPKFSIPDKTLSPDRRYGVTVPIFAVTKDDEPEPTNNVVEVRTGHRLAVIHADTGYDRPLNHHETLPARWSSDSSLLLWEVAGKWSPDTLVLLKLDDGHMVWQRNLLELAQQAILARTRKAEPEKYAEAKKANAGNGSAYPEGFTVDVEVLDPIAFPLHVRAFLSANPKGIED